jgi:hypothetical protein
LTPCRLPQASNREMWAADAGVLEQLQELYSDIDDQIELGSAPAKAPRA